MVYTAEEAAQQLESDGVSTEIVERYRQLDDEEAWTQYWFPQLIQSLYGKEGSSELTREQRRHAATAGKSSRIHARVVQAYL